MTQPTMTAAEYRKLATKKRDVPAELAAQLRDVGLPPPVPEYRFAAAIGRKWRFDLAYPLHNIGIECDGGTWSNGRHTRGKGFEDDCEKLNAANLAGWHVYRFTTEMVERGEALATIERAFRG